MTTSNYIKAGYSLIYVQTAEILKAVKDIQLEIAGLKYGVKIWDFDTNPNPDEVIDLLENSEPRTCVIAKNLNWFMQDGMGGFNKGLVQFLQNRSEIFSSPQYRKVLIVVSDEYITSAIPAPLLRDFVGVGFTLPSRKEIIGIYNMIVKSCSKNDNFIEPTEKMRESILDACRGMTSNQITNALALTVTENFGELNVNTLRKLRADSVESTAGLKILESKKGFDSLKGYNNLKKFCIDTINSPYSKGVMLLGPPGVGKTHFCECLGKSTGKEVISWEMASLFGGLVGETEKNAAQAIDVIKANAPCVVVIDK